MNLASVFDREFSKQFRGDSKRWQQLADLTIIFDNLTSQKINYIEYVLGQGLRNEDSGDHLSRRAHYIFLG